MNDLLENAKRNPIGFLFYYILYFPLNGTGSKVPVFVRPINCPFNCIWVVHAEVLLGNSYLRLYPKYSSLKVIDSTAWLYILLLGSKKNIKVLPSIGNIVRALTISPSVVVKVNVTLVLLIVLSQKLVWTSFQLKSSSGVELYK